MPPALISWQLYPFFDTSDVKRLKRTCNDIVCETSIAKEWPHFPDSAVVIGPNGGGDQLILVPQSDAPHLLGHEVYWREQETGDVNQLTDDFAELDSQ